MPLLFNYILEKVIEMKEKLNKLKTTSNKFKNKKVMNSL